VAKGSQTESCASAPAARERAWTCRLTVVHPPDVAAAFDLDATPLAFGRQAAGPGERSIAHRTVSRRHLEVAWDPALGRHYARDLDSRNGTWLAGQPLAAIPRVLDDNAVLRLGDVVAVYERHRGDVVDAPAVDHQAVPGHALAIIALRGALARAAPDPAPALLVGESGAGKERIAAELHRLSARRGPFIALNCAALSPQLIESQLFGHQRGAFTGAVQGSAGLFRAADGGTLFLDEIGELPLDLQPKLLRAIEQGDVLPLGSTVPQRVDVRVVAATNRELAREVDAGRFRRDLYARLALWELVVPPLARRRVDLLAWLERLAAQWAAERRLSRPPVLDLAPAAVELIVRHRWPENLRGLVRLIHELAHLEGKGPLTPAQLPAWLGERDDRPADDDPAPSAGASLRPRPTRDELLAALAGHGWNISATARYYDRDRKQISRWIAMYAIDLPDP
jgi:DNA-binding NtrC family response regulator